jgi:hypothetical protein
MLVDVGLPLGLLHSVVRVAKMQDKLLAVVLWRLEKKGQHRLIVLECGIVLGSSGGAPGSPM